jgi:predicted unusual protein kinase regulating ubiquinone biosynthesis (AarF/ABC1/UbiB family)
VICLSKRAGEDLLVASADKPFRFPATFTFVVRSFTVLDGIGKGLDPRFDISEIAAPYARSLLLEGNPQYAKLRKEFGKKLALQVRSQTDRRPREFTCGHSGPCVARARLPGWLG